MIFWTVSLLLFLVFIWVLLTPIILSVDTIRGIYEVKVTGILKFWVDIDKDGLLLHIKIPVYHFRIRPQNWETKKSKKKLVKSRPKKSGRTFNMVGRAWKVLRSFKVNVFRMSVDTDNYPLNGQLYPICILAQNKGIDMSINFEGYFFCQLEIHNNIWRMAKAFLRN